ncbi:chaperonin 10-like protein [Boletus edulis BED1]|uniref:Chaperonin 10-like protein n=1 Tax=Boletus edulis BED1 TaxID=1328754 RepID=A0AAD4BC75_BOLED|nr:chaperonin 10-like protein [Boletus edulis BED1]
MSSFSTIPKAQKVWMVVRQGKPQTALEFKTDVPVPKPKSGEVLVKVLAAGYNPVGWKLMGTLPNVLTKRPHPAEHDLAGVIVDANGSSFSNGDEVIGYIPVSLQSSSRQGALAQYATLPEDNVVLKPAKLSWEEAAGLPLAAHTAVQSLRLGGYDPTHWLSLNPTSTPTPSNQEAIFINGGSTAIGIYAIQLAKAMSLHVTATASARNESFVRGVGADKFLDYTARPLAEQLSDHPPEPRFGMILDAAGSLDTALYTNSAAYVKNGGAYVTTGPYPDKSGWMCLLGRWAGALLRPSFLGGTPTTWKIVRVVNIKEDMKMLCTLIERGALRPYVDSTYEFGSALDAYERIMTGRATGKVIVKVE